MCNDCWFSDDGVVTLDSRSIKLRELIDACFLQIAGNLGANIMTFPPLLKVADVDALDYFSNFPHLPLLVSSTDADKLLKSRKTSADIRWDNISHTCLRDASHVLPPAACYAVYIHHQNTSLDKLKIVTTAANCFRNETHYVGLSRPKSFTMRKIIFIGKQDDVTKALENSLDAVKNFADYLSIHVNTQNATDPFFEPNSARAATQKLFPVKRELVFSDGVAISSANFHRNFFGEKFGITDDDNNVAFTACIGMGLERWLHAMFSVYNNDVKRCNTIVREYHNQSTITAPLHGSAKSYYA